MDKKDLVNLLNEIFIPIGFKRKGNNWVSNGNELSKIVNLQKSNYSNSFYINYGYNIRDFFEADTFIHVYNRLAGVDKTEQKYITDLLDLENGINSDQRLYELKSIVINKIGNEMSSINTIEDLRNNLKGKNNLNTVSLLVKKHLQLN